MATPDWYPRRDAERLVWHRVFTQHAASAGSYYGLSQEDIAAIALDAENVEKLMAYTQSLDAGAQAGSAWKRAAMTGPSGQEFPDPPFARIPPVISEGSLAGIVPRTRRYVAIIKASGNYTKEVGQRFGILGGESARDRAPRVKPTARAGSQVEVRVFKAGYSVLAIDSRRGGEWEFIGITMRMRFDDKRAPLTEGQPEFREYRAQGMRANERVGPISPVVGVSTIH